MDERTMNRRDRFAASAPRTIPSWYKPPIPDFVDADVERAVEGGTLTERDGALLREALCAGTTFFYADDVPHDVNIDALNEMLQRIRSERTAELDEYRRNYDRTRYFSWRWYYADCMIATSGT